MDTVYLKFFHNLSLENFQVIIIQIQQEFDKNKAIKITLKANNEKKVTQIINNHRFYTMKSIKVPMSHNIIP